MGSKKQSDAPNQERGSVYGLLYFLGKVSLDAQKQKPQESERKKK